MITNIFYRKQNLLLPQNQIEDRFLASVKHKEECDLEEQSKVVAAQLGTTPLKTLVTIHQFLENARDLIGQGHIVDMGLIGRMRLHVHARMQKLREQCSLDDIFRRSLLIDPIINGQDWLNEIRLVESIHESRNFLRRAG